MDEKKKKNVVMDLYYIILIVWYVYDNRIHLYKYKNASSEPISYIDLISSNDSPIKIYNNLQINTIHHQLIIINYVPQNKKLLVLYLFI